MTTRSDGYRLPAEWEYPSAVLLSWPHTATDWAYMIDEVTQCYINVLRALTHHANVFIVAPDISQVANTIRGLVDMDRVHMAQMPTNDTWARDFGMICTCNADGQWRANDFKFNGWGLKFASCHDNLITRNLIKSGIITNAPEYVNHLSFVLEGGSIDIDTDGTLLTTTNCLLSPNRNGGMSKSEIEQYLTGTLGCTRVIWIEHGDLEGDDTDSHIDTLARFMPGGIIAYTSCDRQDDSHYGELQLMQLQLSQLRKPDGTPYRLVPLPIPEAIYDEEGNRLPATYANFLIINDAIFLPVYGDEKYDTIAIARLKEAAPAYQVIPIDCRALIQQHGSLHCITMQIPCQ